MISPPILILTIALAAEPQAASPSPARGTPAPSPATFGLTVKGGLEGTADIQAKQIETQAIMARLQPSLKVPLLPSKLVAAHKVDLALKGVSVTSLLAALAPIVLADIEIGGSPVEQSWKAIHLLGYNEKEPAPELKQVGFLVAAGTISEDGTLTTADPADHNKKAAQLLQEEPKDPEKPELIVLVENGRVSLRSKRQPVIAILNEISTQASVPFDIRGDVDMSPIDLILRDMPLRDLPAAMGRPDVRLIVRRNLATGEDVVQGIIAGGPAPSIR